MKVLLMGSGGREHALAWKIAQSPLLTELFVAPGNPGIGELATLVAIEVTQIDRLVEFCVHQGIDLVVVGPEVPLVLGVVDALAAVGIPAFGPHAQAAMLEGSKAFAKEFMIKHNIPTARYERFTEASKALSALPSFGLPVVIKADGLAAGKGVVIAQTANEAVQAISEMLSGSSFGDAGKVVVIEEFLTGIEASQLCLVDGHSILPLEGAQDYKRAYDKDLGPNTGGMGTYSPSRIYDETLKQTIHDQILLPFIEGLKADGIGYKGLIFIGLMIENGQPKVIEFNVRFGDPETQSLMLRLDSDLLAHFIDAVKGNLHQTTLKWSDDQVVCVVMASGGYPDAYKKNLAISGIADAKDQGCLVFHAGTALVDQKLVTNGGRVLNVVARGKQLIDARELAYRGVNCIQFDGKMFRTDIAKA